MFAADGGAVEEEERPEDAIVVVDPDGNPYDDDAPLETYEEVETEAEPELDPIENLTRERDQLRQQQQQTAAELQNTRRRLEAASTENHETTKALFSAAVETAKSGLTAAKNKYAEAAAQGDWLGAADAQVEIARHTQEIAQIEVAARDIAEQPAPKPQQARQPAAQQQPADFNAAVDRYISALTPAQQAFAKKHRGAIFPEGDDKPLKTVEALASAAALKHGLDTPEFFAFIEDSMGLKEQPKPTSVPRVAQKRPPIASAPVQRGGTRQTTQVELTAAERDIAKRMGMTPAKYALRKKQIQDGTKSADYNGPRFSRDDPANNGGR